MGGASSVYLNSKNDIYISYDSSNKENMYILNLIKELENNKFHIKKTNDNIILDKSIDYSHKINMINEIINNSLYIFVCITKNTVKSFIQTIELNSVLESNKKIIYLMTDKDYTPLSNNLLYSIVQKNKWYSLYDNETFNQTLNNIKNDIANMI